MLNYHCSPPTIIRLIFITAALLTILSACDLRVPTAQPPEGEASPEPIINTATPEKISATLTHVRDTIAQIQGAGHISPFRNESVSDVRGIVTVVTLDGFYMQSPIPDDDPATSEGLFVFTELVPGVEVGDEVGVDGKVDEMTPGGGYGNLSITQIANPQVTILSSDNALPEPTIIGEAGRETPTEIIDDDTEGFVSESTYFDPENDGLDFYESLEGMLVQVNDAVVVGPTNRYKEIVVLPDLGINASVRTPRGGIVIREEDFNPERIMLDDKLLATPFVNVGDVADGPIVGVMDYDFGNFKIQVTEEVRFNSGGLSPEPPLESDPEGQLRIASYNVLNLSAVEPHRIARLADQIVNRLASPDIIGLQEIQDDDGSQGQEAVSAVLTYQNIIDAIMALGGPQYGFVDIDPVPGTDGGIPLGNIRVGFLFRLDTGLTLVEAPHGDAKTPVEIQDIEGVPTLSLNPGRIEPTDVAFYSSRKPLVVTFLYKEKSLFMINNHFASKGGDRALFGEFQPPILDSEVQRLNQAQVVHDFVAELLAVDPTSRVIVLGDLNDFQFSNPLEVLKGEVLQNLIETLPIEDRYTYIYDGNSQALDHILITDGLSEALFSMDVLHINSEFDYTERFSDHDVLIATFQFD